MLITTNAREKRSTKTMDNGTKPRVWTALTLAALLVLSACGDSAEETEDTTATTVAVQAPLVIQADTVSGPRNIPLEARGSAVCVQQSRFARNSEIVWRARVMDPVSGDELSDEALESVVVNVGDGQTLDMRYGPHPRDNPTDSFWTTSFDIPTDYPTGTLDYEIVATSPDGRTATFKPFDVAPSLLTVTDEVLETVEEEGA
jgi:hypothetical protein